MKTAQKEERNFPVWCEQKDLEWNVQEHPAPCTYSEEEETISRDDFMIIVPAPQIGSWEGNCRVRNPSWSKPDALSEG